MVRWITKKAEQAKAEGANKRSKEAAEEGKKRPNDKKKVDIEGKLQSAPVGKKRRASKKDHSESSGPARSSREKKRESGGDKQKQDWSLEQFKVEPIEGKTRFHDIDLSRELMHGVADLGFEYCTEIQAKALPPILEGKDVAGQAQTGTGKTAAFLLGIFNHLLENPPEKNRRKGAPRVLVLAPTRELVVQLQRDAKVLSKYTSISSVAVYGGVDYAKQKSTLRKEFVDLIAATPGRLLDYLGKKIVNLSQVEYLVIDEADRMLDMGFIPDVRRIIRATPAKNKRQTMLFSATLDEPVMRLSKSWTTDAVRIETTPDNLAAESVDQRVYIVTADQKYALLYNLLNEHSPERAIIFANRRDAVDRLTRKLKAHGFKCNRLSGAIPQKRRMRTLDDFRAGKFNIMVATDVAGRGLHVQGISHIFNYNVPQDAEDYVHRIGRTGRAGSLGMSITFACEKESFYLPPIEELLGSSLDYSHPEEKWLKAPPKPQNNRRRRNRGPRKKGGRKKKGGKKRG